MKAKLTITLAIAVATAIIGAAEDGLSAAGLPVHSVTGQAHFLGNIYEESIAIDASTDEAGNVQGMITWESTNVFGYGYGPGESGYPWYIAVDVLEVSGNLAYVEGIVVGSPQVPEDVGTAVVFMIEDNGDGQSGTPDVIFWDGNAPQPIDAGNFTVR
ncbi:MAG: hypothetical protein ACM3U2_23750 [Deltaproteobacteria bacterium]